MRALFGIGMGGEWGVGASLAMEAAPVRLRGILSGILQSGYTLGYLLAAVAARFLLPAFGWRAMFWAGAAPALLALYIRTKVPESEAWKQHRAATTGEVLRVVAREWKRFAYLVALMTFMMFLSHGTQDLYPDFLKEVHKALRGHGRQYRHHLQLRSDYWRHPLRAFLASGGPAQRHDGCSGLGACCDSVVGVWANAPAHHFVRFPYPNGSAGRLGCHPSALE